MKYKNLKTLVYLIALAIIIITFAVIGYIFVGSFRAIDEVGIEMFKINNEWRPASDKPSFGLMPAIAGTLYVSLLATVIAVLVGTLTSFFISFYVKKKIGNFLLSILETLAGLPSVIFGFIGLSILVKNFVKIFKMTAGQCILAAVLILSLMQLPFVVSTVSESVALAKKKYYNSFISLGLSKEMFIARVLSHSIKDGLVAAGVMAFGRGLGETMAVMMVIGNSPIFPKFFGRGQTIPSLTALEMGNVAYGSLHMSVLFAANLVLLILLIAIILLGAKLKRRAFDIEK